MLRADKPAHSACTHIRPTAAEEDKPENHGTVYIRLEPEGKRTRLTLTQDNNATEEAKQGSEKNWRVMLDGLREKADSPKAAGHIGTMVPSGTDPGLCTNGTSARSISSLLPSALATTFKAGWVICECPLSTASVPSMASLPAALQ